MSKEDNVSYNTVDVINQKLSVLNSFRHLYFKRQFRDWLWERVRKPKIESQYHPNNLVKQLVDEDTDLDAVLDKW